MPIDFVPADPARARTLSQDQVNQFNRLGYISPLVGLSDKETVASRDYFNSLLSRIHAMHDRRNAYSIMGYHNRCRGIYDLALTPRFLDYVEDLLGPDFVMWTSHYFCKEPGDPKRVPWHQDATYWPIRPTRTVTIWLAIDDAMPDNAPMRFLPGTHKLGKVDWQPAQGDVALTQEIDNISGYDEPFDNLLSAGQISIHTSTLIHGSEANQSSQRRCGLTLRYIPSSCGVKPGAEKVLNDAVLCRGNPGQWRDNPRPPADDIAPLHDAYKD
jgi:non-haem Fe2+, alpha-ketoglutarate-dependent halogenase